MNSRLSRVAAAALSVAAAIALAPERVRAAPNVTVQVTQIRATGRGSPKQIDPALEHLRGQLENYPYKKFDRIDVEGKTASEGERVRFRLAGNYALEVVPSEGGSGWVLLDTRLTDGGGGERMAMRLKLRDGGTVLLAKDFEVGDGRLILALTVRRG